MILPEKVWRREGGGGGEGETEGGREREREEKKGKKAVKLLKTAILHLVNIFLFIGLSLYVQSYYPCTVSK